MKKKIALLLALLLLSLTACSLTAGNKVAPDEPEDKDPPAASEPQDPAPAEPAEPEVPDAPAAPEDADAPVQDGEPADTPAPEESGDGEQKSDEPVIRASHTDVTLKSAGESFRFTVWSSEGKDPDSCTYTSADPAVAAVDEAGGKVTAVGPGTTTVTVHVEFGGEKQDFDCIVRCKWTEETGVGEPAEPSQPVSGGAETPSLQEFFTTLQGSYEALGAMAVIEGDLLENYYPGLSGIAAVEEIYVQETMITMANVAVGLVKLSDDATADDVAAVQAVFQSRIDTQAAGGAWYPASCETWEQGVITSASNVVGMFVYPEDAQGMADLFTETFGN